MEKAYMEIFHTLYLKSIESRFFHTHDYDDDDMPALNAQFYGFSALEFFHTLFSFRIPKKCFALCFIIADGFES